MNRAEAYKILEVSPSASEDEIKKRYRELTKKFHPDVNKDPSATDKFKLINEAYSTLQKPEEPADHGFIPDAFNIFRQQQQVRRAPPLQEIQIPISLTFEESILGTEKELSFRRFMKCSPCNGTGLSNEIEPDTCKVCKGLGRSEVRNGNVVYQTLCQACFGRCKRKNCTHCQGKTGTFHDTHITVKIPQGIQDKTALRLQGVGHYVRHEIFNFEQYSDAFVLVSVSKHPEFHLEGNDVVSTIKISLLDAVKGAEKKVNTVHGETVLRISPGVKNKDAINLNNFGVKEANGSHKFIVDIEYPKDLNKLAKFLEKEETNGV